MGLNNTKFTILPTSGKTPRERNQNQKRTHIYDNFNRCRKSFRQISTPMQKVGMEGTYLNIIKAIYDKPTANIVLNGEKLKPFPLRCWRGCGEKGTLLPCWWECKLIQPLWRTIWRFLIKLKIELPYDQQSHYWAYTLRKP